MERLVAQNRWGSRDVKILVVSHGHPDFSIGGAEIAAYNLFRSLQKRKDVETVDFLARTSQPSLTPGALSLRSPGEYLWRQDISDWFMMRTAYPNGIYKSLRAFARQKRPEVIFIHHYAHIGLEMLRELRLELPEVLHLPHAPRIHGDLPQQRSDGEEGQQETLSQGEP